MAILGFMKTDLECQRLKDSKIRISLPKGGRILEASQLPPLLLWAQVCTDC